jgi:exo-beta-1,3-glucanase (GH17 family)
VTGDKHPPAKRIAKPAASDPGSITAKSPVRECLLRNGMAYSPFRDGQGVDPHDSAPTVQQIEEDLQRVRGFTHNIRIYSAKGAYAGIPTTAGNMGMEVMLGIYLGEDPNENKAQIEAALRVVRKGRIKQLIVGNEVLTGKMLSKNQLIEYIRQVKKEVDPTKVQVSTAETWGVWRDNPDLASAVDFVTAHFYPFWEGHRVEGAAQTVITDYEVLSEHLRKQLGRNVKIVIGETGWPSGGIPVGDAVPSPENQHKFIAEFLPLACGKSIQFFYFDVFDEEWKWREGNSDWKNNTALPAGNRTFSGNWIGSSWGVFQSNGKLKPALADLFDDLPPGTRARRDIFIENSGLSAYYDMGVDTSERQRSWLEAQNEFLRMAYPAGQYWGSVFITVGEPGQRPHPWRDFSEFKTLSIEMKGQNGGEEVEIGIMNRSDPANGHERRVRRSLGREYQTYDIPLSEFASPHLSVPEGLKQMYVVAEFVFEGRKARTIYVRNIQYKP